MSEYIWHNGEKLYVIWKLSNIRPLISQPITMADIRSAVAAEIRRLATLSKLEAEVYGSYLKEQS